MWVHVDFQPGHRNAWLNAATAGSHSIKVQRAEVDIDNKWRLGGTAACRPAPHGFSVVLAITPVFAVSFPHRW
jgi:hypothetical protein